MKMILSSMASLNRILLIVAILTTLSLSFQSFAENENSDKVINPDKLKWDSYGVQQGLPDDRITALLIYENDLWVGTWDGLSVIRNNRLERISIENNLLSPHITSISGTSDDLWIGHAGLKGSGGLSHFDGKVWKRYKAEENIISILRMNGRTFCGTWGSGVQEFVDGNFLSLPELPDPKVTTLSAQGVLLWAGTKNAGSFSLDTSVEPIASSKWKIYDEHSSSIINNAVTDIAISKQGIWFATWGGTSLMSSKGEWTPFTAWGDRLADNFVTSVCTDDTLVVFGTNHGITLYEYDKELWKTYRIQDGLVYNSITDVAINSEKICIGTKKGLSILYRE